MNAPSSSLYERFSSILSQREDELRRSLGTEAAALQSADGADVTDFKDVADSEAVAAVEEVKAAHAAAELSQVVAARRRLAEGRYGSCLECGDAIDEGRLLALPYASLCAACQRLKEPSH